MWKYIDEFGYWLLRHLTVEVQMRVGVLCTLASLPFFAAVFFVSEPPLIFVMSAGALLLTGLCIVIAAAPSEEEE